ncbi:MAG: hypothetical protein JW895_14440 [Thermoleophilaceae bacterium]|nr:hypothetical protein [Thermoleophilaceae bacterium]
MTTRRFARTSVAALVAVVLGATGAIAAPGDLDSSFDGDGSRSVDFGDFDDFDDVLIEPGGRIVAAGAGGANTDFVLARLDGNGALDTGFDGDGRAVGDFGTNDYGYAAALQDDGKIVVAGATGTTDDGAGDFAILRLNPDGSPDASFDGDGQATTDLGGRDVAQDVLVQPDGKIVVAGYGSANLDFLVTRLNPDGSPDTDFDGDGTAAIDFGAQDFATSAALQADGKLVVAGGTDAGGDFDFAVARLNEDGSPDSSFGDDGRRTIGHGGTDGAYDVLIQPDRRIVLAGTGADDIAITRLDPDGGLDGGFGGGGTSSVDFGAAERGLAVALQANGKLVVVGGSEEAGAIAAGEDPPPPLPPEPVSRAVMARLQPGGSLDSTFSSDGRRTFAGARYVSGVALRRDGRIAVAGGVAEDGYVALVEGDSARSGGGPAGGTGPGGSGPGGGPGAGGGGGKHRVPRCAGKRATIVGTGRSDRLKGTRRRDVIVALGGKDRVRAGRGNDLVCGGDGNDILDGMLGNDRLYGQDGSDKVLGASGRDSLSGGAGRDRLSGGSGRDKCAGGSGKDRATCERRRSL